MLTVSFTRNHIAEYVLNFVHSAGILPTHSASVKCDFNWRTW